jgi:hypothetical protein
MLYNKGNHAKLKYVQPQSSPLQGENGGKIYSTWNPGNNNLIWGQPVVSDHGWRCHLERVKVRIDTVKMADMGTVGWHSEEHMDTN